MIPLQWKYPQAVLDERERIAREGALRERILFDLEGRPAYAWGILTACDAARFFGIDSISVIEFGVAEGAGLIEMCRLAALIGADAGVSIQVIGFDNAVGLPPPEDFRDHPEVWSTGDFAMGDADALRRRLPASARLIIGDVRETVPTFVETLDAPIGFCSFDVDLYSSTLGALRIYDAKPEKLLPASAAYFDDTIGGPGGIGSLFRNSKAGQLRAIDEFNAARSDRAIDIIRTLKHRRPLSRQLWLDQVYAVHALDHPRRNAAAREAALSMSQHGAEQRLRWPL